MIGKRLRDLVLLPAAIVVVVLEDVIWAGLWALIRLLAALPPIRRLETWLGTLPGWAALPLFLIPEILGRVGELWAIALLVNGHLPAAAIVYLGVRLAATLIAVFVYHACEAALMRYRWFAAMVAWVKRVRDWAVQLIAPWRRNIRAALRSTRSRLTIRFIAMRRALAVGWFRRGS